MKKLLLSLGSVAAVAAPVVTVISCTKKASSVFTIVELGPKDEDGKFLSIVMNLDFGFDINSNAKSVAKEVIEEHKSSFDDTKTEIILKSPVDTIEKTFGEFKALATIPSKLVDNIKDTDLKQYVTDVFTELKVASQP